jgi:hypothetical protein
MRSHTAASPGEFLPMLDAKLSSSFRPANGFGAALLSALPPPAPTPLQGQHVHWRWPNGSGL